MTLFSVSTRRYLVTHSLLAWAKPTMGLTWVLVWMVAFDSSAIVAQSQLAGSAQNPATNGNAPAEQNSNQTPVNPVASVNGQPESETGPPTITVEMIDAALKQLEENAELDEPTKSSIRDIYTRARQELLQAKTLREQADRYRGWVATAEKDIAEVQSAKQQLAGYDFAAAERLDLNTLNKDRAALEQKLSDLKKALTDAQTEPQRRVVRKEAIPKEISNAKSELAKVEAQLAAALQADAQSPDSAAQTALLQAQRQRLLALIDSLEAEQAAYEAQGELPRLRIDLLTAQIGQLEKDLRQLVALTTKRRLNDATAQQADANAFYEAAPDWLKPFAYANLEFATRRLELASEIHDATMLRDAMQSLLARWQEDFEKTRKRTETLDSDSQGPALVEKRSSLPSIPLLQRYIADNEAVLASLQRELYELEDRRAELSDLDAATEQAMLQLAKQGIRISEDDRNRLKETFAVEARILDDLLKDANRLYSLRLEAREAQRQLIDVVTQYREFIDGKVFWVPSAEPLRWSDVKIALHAVTWLFNLETLRAATVQIGRRVRSDLLNVIVAFFVTTFLLIYRSRLPGRLNELGDQATQMSCSSITPTLRAMLVTTLLALPWPAVMWFFAWMLQDSINDAVRLAATALNHAGWWWFTFALLLHLWRDKGLAIAHFGWNSENRRRLRWGLRLLIALGTPLTFLASVFLRHAEADYRVSLGRLSMIALLSLVAVVLWQLTRGTSRSENGEDDRWINRKRLLKLAPMIPIALAVTAAIGFNYSAYRLAIYSFLTVCVLILAILVRAVLYRWVRITRRKIRRQQLLAARQQRMSDEAAGSEVKDIDSLIASEEGTDIIAMDQQTRRLIDLVILTATIAAVGTIWVSVFPAIAPLLNTSINPFHDPSDPNAVTVGNLLAAIVIFWLSIAGCRNIPGLVDVLLLGRLGVESSIRYAITTLSQYAIAIAGVVISANWLGLQWDKLQWLVAAMGVGLGFGLQEVVANFVCGVLLLFERPIRVGDVVTMGSTTGVVVRIRSRATTIRNWDRQEVVIPNKELITGQIVNWTLSDSLNRIVIQVGVAYGTDTNRVRDILFEILRACDKVLDDPAPLVTFEQFGDSTLNFTIRAFLGKMDDRMETIHLLHSTIHQRFGEENIEIAFPQRDLHIRSVDPSIVLPSSRTNGS